MLKNTDINDIRTTKDFKSITISKYKKSSVCNALITSINTKQIESALNWSAELICSGLFKDLWDTILIILAKHIHLANPKLPIFIDKRFDSFKHILHNGFIDNELSMRNNNKIRLLFAEIIIVLCFSNKKPTFEIVKIEPNEFSLVNLSNQFEAPTTTFATFFYKSDDPPELFIPINEFAFFLYPKHSPNLLKACYWLEWTIQYIYNCKKNKKKLICNYRPHIPVHQSFQKEPIWIIWDIILIYGNQNIIIKNILESLLNLFCLKYSSNSIKKKRYILYFAIELLTEKVDTSIKIFNQSHAKLTNMTSKINTIYAIIKKNEISPNTDYLFNGIEHKSNIEKSIAKLDKLDDLNSKFIPRDS